MPQGLQCWDAEGRLIFDTNTMTSRLLGSRTVIAGSTQNFYNTIVPVSPSKRLWWYLYVRGTCRAYMYLDGYVDPTLNIPNRLNMQTEAAENAGDAAFFFWGEY